MSLGSLLSAIIITQGEEVPPGCDWCSEDGHSEEDCPHNEERNKGAEDVDDRAPCRVCNCHQDPQINFCPECGYDQGV